MKKTHFLAGILLFSLEILFPMGVEQPSRNDLVEEISKTQLDRYSYSKGQIQYLKKPQQILCEIQTGILQITAGAEDDDLLYMQGRELINKNKNYLSHISFEQLHLFGLFEQSLLKVLVFKNENRLLAPFIAMYARTHPGNVQAINFIFPVKKDAITQEYYTLYDLAEDAYLVSCAESSLRAPDARRVLKALVDAGAESYRYIAARKKLSSTPEMSN